MNVAATADLFPHGLFRITAASPVVAVADPVQCALNCWEAIEVCDDSHVVLLPELALGGYTCADLFGQRSLLDAVLSAMDLLCRRTTGRSQLLVVGAPLVVDDGLFNTAVVLANGKPIAIVPKLYLPTYREFYEARHFRSGRECSATELELLGERVPFGNDLLLQWGEAKIGIEICEDLWVPIPPSSLAALAGANILLNLSSSNETIGKAAWRRNLVLSQSGRCLAAYAYASAGPTESTTDLVFGGHCMIAENGRMLAESSRVGDGQADLPVQAVRCVTAEVDLQSLAHDRRLAGTWHEAKPMIETPFRTVNIEFTPPDITSRKRSDEVDGSPFVPKSSSDLEQRCAEILSIQSAGLAKRVSRLGADSRVVIGISGGLDSTLALLVAIQAFDANDWSRKRILGVTMPGYGTTKATLANALELMASLGIQQESIDIRQLSLDTFRALAHQPLGLSIDAETTVQSLQDQLHDVPASRSDLVFENVQARIRTFLLMSRGFVLGTGDLSEQALGWSTYNADHMSMYNVNASIPKTLVRFLVRHIAKRSQDEALRELLLRVADTVISPELLPPDREGNIRQDTELSVGPYELVDFCLFHFVRHGFTREKIEFLARSARFSTSYSPELICQTLDRFFTRFFHNQFKRSCVPDGPKVGSVSLSPRGDWRMPSDADSAAF